MPVTTLHFPVLVTPTQTGGQNAFLVKPLFFEGLSASHRRYRDAVLLFKKMVKRRFAGFPFSRRLADHLLWFKFAPDVRLHQYLLEFSIGSHFVKGRFSVASFEWAGQTFACLPDFQNYFFIVAKNERGKPDLRSETERVIAGLLRQLKAGLGKDFDATTYFSHKKAFLNTLSIDVSVNEANFDFESDDSEGIFAAFRSDLNFDGAEEIEKVANDLTLRFPDELRRACYQEALVGQLGDIIYRRANMPLAIVGPDGVGKHSVVEEVIWRYLQQTEAQGGEDAERQRIWHLNPNRVIAGMSIVGQWEKRFEAILKFVEKPEGRERYPDKLLVDNPVALLRIGKSAGSELCLASVLKPYLQKRRVQLVLLANHQEWKLIQEGDRSFADQFQVIRMQEPDLHTSIKIVLENRRQLELQTGCVITVPAISQLFTIQRNYLKNKALPGSAMKLLTQLTSKYGSATIDAQEVRNAFKSFSGMQEELFEEQATLPYEELRQTLEAELVGQPQAVEALAGAIQLVKAKLTDSSKPLASFLFIGPTGVGKTHAAKLLCRTILGSDDKLMRFDMNEYIDAGALYRLIGDSAHPEGQLTGKVRYQPFGVVLLDEIEKAHPSILDLLLQVLDDARLTDSLGRTVDFSNTIIVMTSNLGAREAASQIGFANEMRDEGAVYRKAVERHFRPELVNRIEQMVVFNPLTFSEIQKIAQLQIRELLQRDGFVRRTTIVNVSEQALDWVARRGFDAKMGGRALKRQIERDLTLLSAEQLILTAPDVPVMLDIFLENDRLVPQITPIRFAKPLDKSWLPEIPEESQAVRFFGKLTQRLEQMEREVANFERNEEKHGRRFNPFEDWKHYDFKNKVAVLKESVQFKALRLRERRQLFAPALPFRLKRTSLGMIEDVGRAKEALRDRLFQLEAMQALREEHRQLSPAFDSFQTDYLVSFFDLAFLEQMMVAFLEKKVDKVHLRFDSCVTHAGSDEVAFLVELYCNLFRAMDVAHSVLPGQSVIEAEEHGLAKLIDNEAGLHLFYGSGGVPVPIRLEISINGNTPAKATPLVVRVYGGKDTLADLRTGYTNSATMTPDEHKLLLFGGIAL